MPDPEQPAFEPCPFCGGRAERRKDPGKIGVLFGLVVDHSPGCFLTFTGRERDDKYDLAWNTRPQPALPADVVEAVARDQFRILGGGGATIDWQLVEDHAGQAKKNHNQTVKRLHERGGLSWDELHAVLHNRPWAKMDQNIAIIECRALEARYLAALAASGHAALIERVRVLEEALRPFVEGYSHTKVFLETREKMHSAGRDLYAEDVERAKEALP